MNRELTVSANVFIFSMEAISELCVGEIKNSAKAEAHSNTAASLQSACSFIERSRLSARLSSVCFEFAVRACKGY